MPRVIAVIIAVVLGISTQPTDNAWVFLVDDLHLGFAQTGRLRDLLRTAAGDRRSSMSVAATTSRRSRRSRSGSKPLHAAPARTTSRSSRSIRASSGKNPYLIQASMP
jgi:hypothetical protein